MSLRRPRSVRDLLTYRLNRLMAGSGAMITRLCEGRYGITRREWRLICLLADAGSMSPSQLSAQAHLERGRVSKHITDLIDKRLLVRQGDASDGRRAVLRLTDAGRRLYDELFPQSVALNREVLRVLSAAEVGMLDRMLERLTERAEAMAGSHSVDAKADRRHGGSRKPRPNPLDPLWRPLPAVREVEA